MKKILSILLVLAVVCTSVFAFDVSFGGFIANTEGRVSPAGFVSVSYEPFELENFNFGVKADYLVGYVKNNESHLGTVGSVKAVASTTFDNYKVLAALGVGFNGFASTSVRAFVTEVGASYNFANSFSVGASFDCAFGLMANATAAEKFIPAGKLFVTYTF